MHIISTHPHTRILVVDDYEPWRQSVRLMLESTSDVEVVGEARDGWEAIQMAQILRPDLILLDIALPKLNGMEVANRLHRLIPSAKVLFLSQNSDAEIVRAALRDGAKGYVLKTDAGSELLPAIKAVLRGENFFSSGIKVGRC